MSDEVTTKRIGRPPIDPRRRRSEGTAVRFSAVEIEWLDSQRPQGESRASYLMRVARAAEQ